MTQKEILFISWQGGMGHITRDLAIVQALHSQSPSINVRWLAHPLAARVLAEAGEAILPESASCADYNQMVTVLTDGFKLNLMKYVGLSSAAWARNVELFKQVLDRYSFDLIVGDEVFEITSAMQGGRLSLDCHLVMIEDFVGMEATTLNPLERYGIYQNNRWLARQVPLLSPRVTRFFVGELEDVPDTPYGFRLPNRRATAKQYYRMLGYVLRFDPAEYQDKASLKARLGYGPGPLLICATGGTSAGKELLELCGNAYPLLKKQIPDLCMVAVCGELFDRKPPALPMDVVLHNYLPDLYQHYAACDMAVVVGGGTTTTELTALRRPFIFFPLENQFDQQHYIAERQARHGAGIKMRYFQTSPQKLARAILANIGREVSYAPIPVDGAQKAAAWLVEILAN